MTDSNPDLAALRQRLDELDGKLLEIVAERLQTVQKIKQSKRASGKHLFDRSREQSVFENAELRGASLGLGGPLVRSLMTTLIEASHDLQEQDDPAASNQVTASLKRHILVLGGRGKMGRRFVEVFQQRGHQLEVLERGETLTAAQVARADITMICVPMSEAVAVTRSVGPMVRSDALLCDINSLKEEVCQAMAETCQGEAMGMHPMFGPTVSSFRRQKMVLCPIREGAMSQWLSSELGNLGLELIQTQAATHDRMMAVIQVLTHFGIMTMGRALSRSGLALHETLPYMSPIYRLELSMIGRLFSQDPQLYQEILMRNSAGKVFRQQFVEEAQALCELIDQDDRPAFEQGFKEASDYFSEFSAEAMKLSDQLIETIVSRP